jgi:signal transduction histidine kinase
MLSNVGRHACATQIDVRILANADHLSVRVQDNGKGATTQAFEAPTAYGVMGMRERARPFGGHIHIESEPGKGSVFALHMPLHHD